MKRNEFDTRSPAARKILDKRHKHWNNNRLRYQYLEFKKQRLRYKQKWIIQYDWTEPTQMWKACEILCDFIEFKLKEKNDGI